jgi:hypothetical protein
MSDPTAFGSLEENLLEQIESNNHFTNVFLTGPLQPPPMPMANTNQLQFRKAKKMNVLAPNQNAAVVAASKLQYQSNMVQQPSCYPYRDKIVVTGKQIIQDSHCVTSLAGPDTSTCFYDSTVNYTSPYSSAYIDSNCIQSSPVAEVPSISSTSFDNNNSFEPIYYTDLSTCPDYYNTNNNNNNTSSEKSVDDWIQYLHSDEEGNTSFDESFGVNNSNCDTLFPEFGEDDLSMLDTILAEENFLEELEPSQPQQDMPAGSSASPQYQYLPEQHIQQPSVSHYIPIAPKPSDYQEQQPSPTSSTSSSTTKSTTTNRKRQRIEFSNSEEEYRIKRNLNNIASARSRQKKREQQEFMKQEKVRLESRNRQLKNEVEEYDRQIATLKEILYSKIKK